MKPATFPALVERFFIERLMRQRRASPHTVSSYRDTFRLLLRFAKERLHKAPSLLMVEQIDAPLITAFLDDLELHRGITARSRNLRLAAVRSFFRYTAYEEPAYAQQIQRVLAIPEKRCSKALVKSLSRPEVDALLAAPDQRTWLGRRDHALILTAVQTGLRLSELTGLRRQDVHLERGPHVRCLGKGRKERCVPLAKQTVTVLKTWLLEPIRGSGQWVFSTMHGGQLSADAVQDLLAKYRRIAAKRCPSLRTKPVTPHVLRHTLAMELLQAGVDRSVIALWLGHESVETTQVYFDADLALREKVLSKTTPHKTDARRFKAEDSLLAFLKSL
jgi:site-specific recombinase XerD